MASPQLILKESQEEMKLFCSGENLHHITVMLSISLLRALRLAWILCLLRAAPSEIMIQGLRKNTKG